MADGRTRAFVNDQPVSVQVLRAVGVALVEIHGEHDDRAMIDPRRTAPSSMPMGGLQERVARVAEAVRRHREARRALDEQARAHREGVP